jgi:hypothetical protein
VPLDIADGKFFDEVTLCRRLADKMEDSAHAVLSRVISSRVNESRSK